MRLIFAILALVPLPCFGLGVDNVEYIGIFADGSSVSMSYTEDSFAKLTGNNSVYGSTSRSNLKYCWANRTSIKKDDPYSERNHTHFVCAKKIGEPPVVFSKKNEKHGVAYQKAMAIFKETGNCESEFGEYYSCEKGCNDSIPTLVFEVLHWEHACE